MTESVLLANNSTSLSISHAMFDNFPAYLQQKPVISLMEVPATHQHFITSPIIPTKPKSFFECLKGRFKTKGSSVDYVYKK